MISLKDWGKGGRRETERGRHIDDDTRDDDEKRERHTHFIVSWASTTYLIMIDEVFINDKISNLFQAIWTFGHLNHHQRTKDSKQ